MDQQIDEIILEGIAEELQEVLPPGITLHIEIDEEATTGATWPKFSLVFTRVEDDKLQKYVVDLVDAQISACRLRYPRLPITSSVYDSYYLHSYDIANPKFPGNMIKDFLKNLRDEIWQ
jgi:hypothetical protein